MAYKLVRSTDAWAGRETAHNWSSLAYASGYYGRNTRRPRQSELPWFPSSSLGTRVREQTGWANVYTLAGPASTSGFKRSFLDRLLYSYR